MTVNRYPKALLLMLVAGCLLLHFVPSPASASVYCVPVLAVKLDTSELHARLPGGVATTVTFTGQMCIDKLPVERCVVTLVSSTDIGWTSTISPTTAVFTSTKPQSFTCTVFVPAGTLQNQTGNLVIKGHAHAGGQELDALTKGIIIVEPYFRIWLSIDRPITEIVQGEQCFFSIEARNGGNAIDSFEMEIANLEELRDDGWAVVLRGGTLPKIQSGDYRSIRLTAQSPKDDRAIVDKVVNIELNVTSQNAKDLRQAVSEAITLTIHVRSVWLPSLSPYLLILSLSVIAAYLAAVPGRDQERRR